MRTLLAILIFALGAGAAHAQTQEDHLQCYKITNANLKKLKGVVDLDAPGIGASPGCKLKKATHYCVPARSEVQAGTLFDGREPLDPDPFESVPSAESRICYQVACPKGVAGAPDQLVQDAFGLHALTRLRTQMICAPATPPPASAFRIVTPEIEIAALQEIAYCYYFRTANNVPAAIRRFSSTQTAVVRQAVFVTTETIGGGPVEKDAPGTVSAANCGIAASGSVVPRWVYESHAASSELTLPADDGTGKPLAIEVPPNTPGFLLMHMFNPTEQPMTGQVTIEAEALVADSEYTATAAFVTYDSTISIPPQSAGHLETLACPAPSGAQFWRLTTNTHQHSVSTAIRDGGATLFQSTDWEEPGAQVFAAPSFATFSSGELTTECTYNNPRNITLMDGDSFAVDEVCMAIGYFFPASGPQLCYGGIVF